MNIIIDFDFFFWGEADGRKKNFSLTWDIYSLAHIPLSFAAQEGRFYMQGCAQYIIRAYSSPQRPTFAPACDGLPLFTWEPPALAVSVKSKHLLFFQR